MSSYQFSDEDSTDSDSGIRFKTTNTRNPGASFSKTATTFERRSKDLRNTSSSSRYRSHRSRERSHSRTRRDRSRSRDNRRRSHRTPEKVDRRKNDDYKRNSRREPEKRPSLKSREKEDDIKKSSTIDNSLKQSSVELDLETFGTTISSKLKREPANIKESVNLRINKETINVKVKNSAIKLIKVSDSFGPALPPAVKNVEQSKSGLDLPKLKCTKLKPETNESICGPALPPRLLNKTDNPKLSKADSKDTKTDLLGPALPQNVSKSKTDISNSTESPSKSLEVDIILSDSEEDSPNAEKDKTNSKDDTKSLETIDSEDDVLGPSLPPNQSKSESKVLGPFIPLHLRETLNKIENNSAETVPLPESSDDEEMIGPLPAGQNSSNPIFTQLEERALEIKLNRLKASNEDVTVREEWMLELPQVQAANLGLGPRQFRAKGVPDMSDRSSWTDTPVDKAKKDKNETKPVKVDLKKEAELKHIKERDLEQEKLVEKLKKKKKRDKSLLDLHQEEFNKKKKTDEEKQERRPFNRDIDLKANRFDEAQKKSILKKAQLLDTRFSTGESKFL